MPSTLSKGTPVSANTAVARTTHHLLDRHRGALVGARTHAGRVAQVVRPSAGRTSWPSAPCVDCPTAA